MKNKEVGMRNKDIVEMSAIDTARYGAEIARANDITRETLPNVLDFCHDQQVNMLIARCRTTDLPAAQEMERNGFLLMDTLVYYGFKYARTPIPEDVGKTPIRFKRSGDEAQVEAVARDAFQGYFGHYHADSRLSKEKADEAYVSWAVRSCVDTAVADDVLIAGDDGVLGFATLRMNTPQEGEGVLFGVAPAAQGRGIYRSFMIRAMQWVQEQGADTIVVSTQVTNIPVQKVWARLGFTMSHSFYTFHKWF
jgi:GNAT superfamily N-acetyltransferase